MSDAPLMAVVIVTIVLASVGAGTVSRLNTAGCAMRSSLAANARSPRRPD